jgi:hypothetical protein
MTEHFGWELYRFHVPALTIQEHIEVWKARLEAKNEQDEEYKRKLGI